MITFTGIPTTSEEKKSNDGDGKKAVRKWPPLEGALPMRKVAPVLSSSMFTLSICSFNVLAESYCSPRSHRNLPDADFVFSPKRRELLKETLKRLSMSFDVLCLQEVDTFDKVVYPLMNGLGYDGYCVIREGKRDGCAIFYKKSVWSCLASECVQFDDLASLATDGSTSYSDSNGHTNALFGFQRSFLRRNAAALIVIEHSASKQRVVISSAHLFWNPGYEYVKLAQIKYLVERIHRIARMNSYDPINHMIPVIMCGDFNSKPGSIVTDFIKNGVIDGRMTAPWRYFPEQPLSDICDDNDDIVAKKLLALDIRTKKTDDSIDVATLPSRGGEWKRKSLHDEKLQDSSSKSQTKVRYLLDFSLNKFCRWLRIFGIDAALETEDEEKERTSNKGLIKIFNRCREEKRALITTSNRLLLRKDCPPGAFLVNFRDIEKSFIDLLLTHGIVLEPSKFLTKCTVCNGKISKVTSPEMRNALFTTVKAPDDSDLCVYSCNGCSQPYWWSERPESSASRVKNKAAKLFRLALQAGVPIEGDLSVFDFVDVEMERKAGKQNKDRSRLQVVEWFNTERLTHTFKFSSIYENIPFTNITSDFVGALDYIFYDQEKWMVTHELHVPTSFNELNVNETKGGHLLPSMHWPSDHLPIGAHLSFKKHANDCACGCMPAEARSIFEMAELRKQIMMKGR